MPDGLLHAGDLLFDFLVQVVLLAVLRVVLGGEQRA